MTEKKFLQIRLAGLIKWKREIGEEFEKWPHYTIKWFLNQMNMIDKRIEEVEKLLESKPLTNK